MILSLAAESIAITRGQRLLFGDLSFQLAAGRALVVEGANGVGKTSLLKLVAGFLELAQGRIALTSDAREISDGEERGRHVAFLGHQDALKPQMTAEEQLTFFARLYCPKNNKSGDITGALKQVGLARQAGLSCCYLSAGQKKRLGLARLLLSGRSLWLLDEPLAALDAARTSLRAAAILRERSNWSVMLTAPPVLTDVISETPATCPSLRSKGAATVAAIVAGSPPGNEALTTTTGKSTRGSGATGRAW